ncbi:MAG: carbohydrate ABC transporter permease [Clostridiales bacterium]|nr:carbohydrate ABC transporter permease [Clostridiales bacterium]MBQ6270629.1 carbohydrate ABC transporter permease [Clostridiales bacterium]MCR5058298.1 carbohydrate ABC transporter permease [Clostridiales bacterium]
MSSKKRDSIIFKTVIYIVCIILALLSIWPFLNMLINSTRSTAEITSTSISLVPSKYMADNIKKLNKQNMFKPLVGLKNSFIISTCVTVLSVYFSCLTAYAIFAYQWKLKKAFFGLVVGVMMLPGTVTMIGFYRACYQFHLTNNKLMLILPSIAAPMTVFFMKQYLEGAVSLEIVESARIDGSGEFHTFNSIVLPIMKPAMATQAIFAFVGSWNNYFLPMILFNKAKNYTMPIMVSLLRMDQYKTEYGCVYIGLSMTALPLIIIYLFLSKYIVSGVALGSVKG